MPIHSYNMHLTQLCMWRMVILCYVLCIYLATVHLFGVSCVEKLTGATLHKNIDSRIGQVVDI